MVLKGGEGVYQTEPYSLNMICLGLKRERKETTFADAIINILFSIVGR